MTLKEIDKQISDLQQVRHKLLVESEVDDAKFIHSLVWTKDYKANVQINLMRAYGTPLYTIYLYGSTLPSVKNSVSLPGGQYYPQNNDSSISNGFYLNYQTKERIEVYDDSQLELFLSSCSFKEITYDTYQLNSLLIIKKYADQAKEKQNG